MLGEGARAEDCSNFATRWGWTCRCPVQYGRYLAGVLHGNLGESFRFQQPVARVVLSHYPATLELAFVALLVCAAIGIPAGMLAAERRGDGRRITPSACSRYWVFRFRISRSARC